jgi:D-alanyl-D-alanine carboxypeptidase
VTLRQLLGHTAGLPDYGGLPEYNAAIRAAPERAWSGDEFLARTLPRGPLFAPGEGWAYSNIGYLLVRQIIERATGELLATVLRQHLLDPLGLRQTSVVSTLADAAALAPGWSRFLDPDGEVTNITPRYDPGWVAHGVVAATAEEVAALIEAIVAGPLLGEAERATLLTPRLLPFAHPPFRQPAYSIGLMLDPASPYGLVAGHGGGGPGYAAAAFHFAALAGEPITIVALLNRDHNDAAMRVVFTLAELLTAGDQG